MVEKMFEGFTPPPQEQIKKPRPSEKLEGAKKTLWEKTKNILEGLGLDFSSEQGDKKEKEIVGQIKKIKQMVKGKDYDNGDDNLFVETNVDHDGKPAIFKMVAQMDTDYDPNYEIDYAKESPDYQKEAERRLMREAVIGQKFSKFGVGNISADTIEESQTTPGEQMYLLKSGIESKKAVEDFGYEEGRQLAVTLLKLQYSAPSSEIVNEIMEERNYKDKDGNKDQYRLENEFSEDIHNDFNGFLDHYRDRGNKNTKQVVKEMEKYREIIENRQMNEDEYSLVFNNTFLDNLRVAENGEVRLSDWSNIGTTQNRELSLINDISQALESARDALGNEQLIEFERGIKEELVEFYANSGELKNKPEDAHQEAQKLADAVMRLTKLTTFSEL